MENEKDIEIEPANESENGGIIDDISSVGQIIIGEIESIGGMLTGDPITRAEGNYNADAGIIREEIKDDLEEAEEEKEKKSEI